MMDNEIRFRTNSAELDAALDEYKESRGLTRHQAAKELTTKGLIRTGHFSETKEAK